MRIIKKILFRPKVAEPKPAPCGHVPPVFPVRKSQQHIVITLMPQEFDRYTTPGAVWCGSGCGWVNLSETEYKYFVSFNGNETA